MTMKIVLQHVSGVKKTVEVKFASRFLSVRRTGPCLEIVWPIAGMYTLFLNDNSLLLPKKLSVWSAEDIKEAWAVWVVLCPGKPEELLKLIPKDIQESEPVKLAIEFRRREAA